MKICKVKSLLSIGVVLALGAVGSTLPVCAQNSEPKEQKIDQSQSVDPRLLVRQLQEAIQKGDLQQAEALSRDLGQQGDDAVAAVQAAMRAQNNLRAFLLFALGQIPGDASTNALLENAYRDRDVGNLSLARLAGRPVNRPLSPEELESWRLRVQNSNAFQAGATARLLSLCWLNNVEQRAKPIIARFTKEVLVQEPVGEVHGSYLSARTVRLNQFLIAFSQFKDPMIIRLLQQEVKSQVDPLIIQWLTFARGFAGDDSVATQLQSLVAQEKDASTKAVALRAYSRSAKEAALPLLETFLNDKTVTGNGSHGPYYGLQIVARDEIARFRTHRSANN